jgi:transposase InsO family protein
MKNIGTETYDGKKYLLNVMDEYTRIIFVAGLRKKSDAATALIEIIEAAERQFEKRVKFLQTDQGGEFRSEELQLLLRSRGIIQKGTVPRHSETNPQIERANRTIVTMARTTLLVSGLPKRLWFEARDMPHTLKIDCRTQLSEVKYHLSYSRKQTSRRNENFSEHLEKEYMTYFRA